MMTLTPRTQMILRAAGFGAFYLLSLTTFAYISFPYDRLRDRLVQEFNARQTGPDGMRLEIGSLDAYWFSGVEAENVRLFSKEKPATAPEPGQEPKAKAKPMFIDSAHVRAGILPWIFGSKRFSFGAQAFGGKINGTSSENSGGRSLDIELDQVSLAEAPMLADLVGLPMTGMMNGRIDFTLPEGKLAKADGTVKVNIEGLGIGDGKAKIKDTIALPKVEAGTLELDGEATAGQFKIGKFQASGPDLEFIAEGSVRLRDPLPTSLLTMTARFKIKDKYKNKSDTTRSIFGAPGENSGLFDIDPKNRRAKRADGFYSWRVTGTLAKPTYLPNPGGGQAPARGTP